MRILFFIFLNFASFIASGQTLKLNNNLITITSDGRLFGSAIHNNSGSLTGTTSQYIASGTYTFTPVNGANVAASTPYAAQWIRVGNVVTVSGKIDVDPTLALQATEVGVPLPIASDFANDYELAGINDATISQTGGMKADATNNRASINYSSTSVSNASLFYQYTYTIF